MNPNNLDEESLIQSKQKVLHDAKNIGDFKE